MRSGLSLVIRRGEVRAVRGDGTPFRDKNAPWTTTTVSQVGSISKQFVAATALLLSAQGAIDLDAPVADRLPLAGPAWTDVTMIHLLTHTAGVPHWRPGLDPATPMEPRDRLAAVLAARPVAPPGAAWSYSSPGYLVAAAALEAVTGCPYPELVSRLIIEPLGLTNTTAGRRPHRAAEPFREGAPIDGWDLSSVPGTGDIWSTADDIATFVTAVYDRTLLPAEMHNHLAATRVALPQPLRGANGLIERTHYGLGHFIGTLDGAQACFLPGDNPGFQALAVWLPRVHEVIVALSNDDIDDVQAAVARAPGLGLRVRGPTPPD